MIDRPLLSEPGILDCVRNFYAELYTELRRDCYLYGQVDAVRHQFGECRDDEFLEDCPDDHTLACRLMDATARVGWDKGDAVVAMFLIDEIWSSPHLYSNSMWN